MNSILIDMIKKIKDGDSNALYDLIIKFDPLITKYSNLLHYEDAKCDLILCFIEIIKKLSLKKNFIDDKFVLSYINKSIINSYVNINRYKYKISDNEYLCEIKDWSSKIDFQSNIEFYDLLKCLNEKEKNIIMLRYLNCLSDFEISRQLNVSRQYVNKLRRQALFKIKSNIN